MLGRCLAEGFAYQGEPSPYRKHERRGEPSAHLPPDAFVNFLQNHDQVGNRAFGERLHATRDARDIARHARDLPARAFHPAPVHGRGIRRRLRRSSSSPTSAATLPTRCATGAARSSRASRRSTTRRRLRPSRTPARHPRSRTAGSTGTRWSASRTRRGCEPTRPCSRFARNASCRCWARSSPAARDFVPMRSRCDVTWPLRDARTLRLAVRLISQPRRCPRHAGETIYESAPDDAWAVRWTIDHG